MDSFLLNAFGTVSVTVEVSRPSLRNLLPWNVFHFFSWSNPEHPEQWVENDVDATIYAMSEIVNRMEGVRCNSVAAGAGGDGRKGRASPIMKSLCLTCSILALWLSACSSPGYHIDNCPRHEQVELPPARGGLRVATLNMWGIPFISKDISARFSALAERLNADKRIDVIALQEMWSDKARKKLLDAVAGEYPFQADFQTDFGDSGLVILSRKAFVGAPQFMPFKTSGKWWKPWTGEYFGGKGVGLVQIQLDDSKDTLWFAATHLHACYESDKSVCGIADEYLSYRQEQLDQLRRELSRIVGDDAAVVAGDFNLSQSSVHFRTLLKPLKFSSGGEDLPWIRIPELLAPPDRIDHIWIRGGVGSTWYGIEPVTTIFDQPVGISPSSSVALSDHCALATTITRSQRKTR